MQNKKKPPHVQLEVSYDADYADDHNIDTDEHHEETVKRFGGKSHGCVGAGMGSNEYAATFPSHSHAVAYARHVHKLKTVVGVYNPHKDNLVMWGSKKGPI